MATYTLTTNGDNLVGTAGNDTFNGTYDAAVTDTFGANDFLNGGTGIDTLHIDHLLDVAITPPDNLWTNLRNIENVVINTTGNGAQTITTGVNFQAAFADLGVGLTTTTSGAGAIDIGMTTFTGAATLKTTSTAGAQTIVTGSGTTTVTASSDAGSMNIKGVGLNKIFATTTGAGAQIIGDGSGNGANLALVKATSAGGAQTITSTSTSAVVVEATSAAGKQIITTNSGADTITASTTSATNTINTGAGNDRVTILATTSGNYTINGGTGNDTITGGAGNDALIGDLGNDILNGGAGVDNMMGGDGSDVYYVDIATDVVSETNALASTGGIDKVNSSLAAYTLGANLENLTLIGTAAINGTGNALNNTIIGNAAANTLNGGAGNDILNGGTGIDTLIGGGGNDIYVVENAGDVVSETSTLVTEIDTVQSSINYTLGANVENLTLIGTAAINGTGNALNNTIIGNAATNTLNGGAGNDILNGGTGIDTLIGGGGNDIYVVENAGDVVSETSTLVTEIDTVQSSINYTLGANVENLTLIGTAAINGTGNALNNTITGNAAANILNGGTGIDTLTGLAGNDILVGGFGNDILTGGTGADSFRFNAPTEGIDRIADFKLLDNDILQISAAGFGGGLAVGTLASNMFLSGSGATTATNANQRFIYNSANGGLFFDADGNGALSATIQIATLTGMPALNNSNIEIIA